MRDALKECLHRQGKLLKKVHVTETVLGHGGRPAAASMKSTITDFVVQEVSFNDEVAALMYDCDGGKARDGPYRFVLRKQGLTTPAALDLLAKEVHVPYDTFRFSGLKDRQATTTQFVTYRGNAIDLHKLRQGAKSCEPRVAIGNIKPCDSQLTHGGFKANKFTITMRDVASSATPETLAQVASSGFVNYYGLQRFGSRPEVSTADLGRCVYKRDWGSLLQLLLAPNEADDDNMQRGKQKLMSTGDAHRALKRMPATRSPERSLMIALAKMHPKGGIDIRHLSALASEKLAREGLGTEVLRLYCAAYQALLWNKMASSRLQMARTVVPGDIVIEKPARSEKNIFPSSLAGDIKLRKARVVEEGGQAAWTLQDIAIPLLGSSAREMENGRAYSQLATLLAKDGVSEADVSYFQDTLGLHGDLRPLVVVPSHLDAKLIQPGECLLGEPLRRSLKLEDDAVGRLAGARPVIQMSFTLPPGAYATMCIREALFFAAHQAQHS